MPMISLPRQLVRTRHFTNGVPDQFTVAPDGASALFLRSRAGDDPISCLWALDLATGGERLLVDPAELLGNASEDLPAEERVRRERSRVRGCGIVAYATDAKVTSAVFALSGGLWTVDTHSGAIRRLVAEGGVVDPRLDPTGQRIAYVSDGTVRVIEADGTGDRAVAVPDGADVSFGLAEHVAAESMGRHRGYWWAPDGTKLLVARVDTAAVTVWYITDPASPATPPRAVRYPAVGTVNADVTLWIVALDGSRIPVGWDRQTFEYVTAAGWDAHGPYAGVQTRDQGTVHILAVDPADGSTRILSEQRDEHWVQLVAGLPVRTESGALVTHTDLGGTRYLAVDGATVTPPGLQLHEVIGVDGDEVLFAASTDPTELHLWTYRADEGIRQLSDAPGVHTGVRRAATLVLVARTPQCASSSVTVRRAAGPDLHVAAHPEQPVLTLRRTLYAVGPRELRTMLFLPSWHQPGTAKLPVLLDPYAGSAMQKVTKAQVPSSFVSQWFAEQGFAVLVTDGSGTPGRGPVWEREVHGDMFGPVLDDQVAALAEVGRLCPDLDLGRVGIRGWSFGGSLAALAGLRRPDVFHAAVAGAGVSDQRLYDTHWRERFLGHPDQYPERYDACSLILAAPKLTRPLLLVHGLADDNVFPANTLRLSAALLAAGRPHEVLPLTRVTHMGADETTMENLLRHQLDFLRRSLGITD